jgi:hypothetical protein
MEYLWAWGTLIHEKNLSSKISCQTPFNLDQAAVLRMVQFKKKYTDENETLKCKEYIEGGN